MALEALHTSSVCAAPKCQPQPKPVLTTGLLRGAADRLTRSLLLLSLAALSHLSTVPAPMTKMMLHEFLQAARVLSPSSARIPAVASCRPVLTQTMSELMTTSVFVLIPVSHRFFILPISNRFCPASLSLCSPSLERITFSDQLLTISL